MANTQRTEKSKSAVKVAKTSTDGEELARSQEVVGEVISDKMDKTISVKIFRRVRHSKYGKYMKKTSVFKAHDEKSEAKQGDRVRIQMCRPLSKTKRWRLVEVVEKAIQEIDGVEV